ncbi:hypothetical protein RIR_jg4543.t1 [Rhizophagus irregularis DAOM 181602=DAOM 197198]|nr:hypothetical protein RIR_jg4543.t1 [Rhizophagus irregularis DAOM 181602=DAOM 197198]
MRRKYQLLTFEVFTKRRKLIDSDNKARLQYQLQLSTTKRQFQEPGPKDIIKHPSDLNLPVNEKSSLYVRKTYVLVPNKQVELVENMLAPKIMILFCCTQ